MAHRDGRGLRPRTRGRPVAWAADYPGLARLSSEQILQVCFELMLHRQPDPGGSATYIPMLNDGTMTPQQLVEWIQSSEEWARGVRFTILGASLHGSRCQFVRSLPPARRILDLGGTALGRGHGALVMMGYPYPFDEVVVVDLPPEERNDLYQEASRRAEVRTELGPVRYRYHSMTDLSGYDDASFDMVYSGQSIEHVHVEEARRLLAEVGRVLAPGGFLAIDTPNARITRLQQADFIDPDHKYEYTHEEMAAMLEGAGFEILESKGLNSARRCLQEGVFSAEEVATARGVYTDIESCYLLSYLCRVRP